MNFSNRGAFASAAFAGLLACGAAVIYNLNVNPMRRVSVGAPLGGVTAPVAEEKANWTNLKTGKWQGQAETKIEAAVPIRPWLVRLNNELRYTLFHQLDNVLVGRNGELIEPGYIEEYCHRNIYLFLPQAKQWASRLRQVQDKLSARGQYFMYLITPSKASVYPEYFTDEFDCPAPRSQRTRLLAEYKKVLDAAGVNYVDGTAWAMQHRYDYDADVFPRGGIHWSPMAAAPTALEIIKRIQLQLPQLHTPSFSIAYRLTNTPQDTDADLAELANLLYPRTRYPVFDVKLNFPGVAASSCKPVHIALIAGSFGHQITNSLGQGGCINVDYFYYYELRLDLAGPQGTTSTTPVPADAYPRINTDEVVILEENENLMTHSTHGQLFFDKTLRSTP